MAYSHNSSLTQIPKQHGKVPSFSRSSNNLFGVVTEPLPGGFSRAVQGNFKIVCIFVDCSGDTIIWYGLGKQQTTAIVHEAALMHSRQHRFGGEYRPHFKSLLSSFCFRWNSSDVWQTGRKSWQGMVKEIDKETKPISMNTQCCLCVLANTTA